MLMSIFRANGYLNEREVKTFRLFIICQNLSEFMDTLVDELIC